VLAAATVRVVSLLPSATDMIAALGAAPCLVGITHECDAVEAVARVTATAVRDDEPAIIDLQVRSLAAAGAPFYALDASRIAALHPDVLITQALCEVCAVHEGDVRALAATLWPPPVVVTLAATTLEGVLTDLQRVAGALGIEPRGASVVAALRARLRAIHDALHVAAAPRPTVAVIEWPDPVFAAGHWVPEMVRRAGGRDVLSESGAHSATVAPAVVAAADPDVLVIAPCGFGAARAADAARTLLARDEWQWARQRTVWAIDANALTSRPGPRLIEGVEVLAALLHPALFPHPATHLAVQIAVSC
jgi:iron complex transport system substrate-binding protein